MSDLPAELFMPGRLWFIGVAPVPDHPIDALRHVNAAKEPGREYLAAFTSREAAERFMAGYTRAEDHEVFSFPDLGLLGRFLDRFNQSEFIAFDPEWGHAELQRVADAACALYRYVVGPGFN